MIQTLSSSLIDQRKTETLEAQNLRKVVPFRDITLIDGDTIDYKGTHIPITKGAFKNILGLLGMSQSFATKFENLFTKEAKAQFINTMKNAMSSNSDKLSNITLVLNPISKAVIAITKQDEFGISNQQFLQVAENIIDNHSMEVSNWSIDPINGIITINTFNPNANFAVQGLSDEVFSGGVTFMNSPKNGFQVLPYINRLFCANGSIHSFAQEAYTLNSLDNNSMEKFFENINVLRKNNFAPIGFADRVRVAHNTPASLSELGFAHRLIEPFAGDRTDSFIPLNENINEYHKAGFESLTSDQMKAAKSNTSVWSAINAATFFASHGSDIIDTNMQGHDATNIMIAAGILFGKRSFDHETSMPDIFTGRELDHSGSLLN